MIYYISQYFQIVSENIIPALGGAVLSVEGICFSQTIEMSTKSFPVILVAAVFFALYLFTNDKSIVEEHITTAKPEVVY